MPRPEKVAKVEEVSTQLTSAAATLLTHYRGLSVSEISELRTRLREANADLRVVKNTLTRRAAAKAGMDGLNELLVGPTGLVLCEEDPVGPAKVLKAFAKDHPDLTVRGGYLDGEVLDEVAAIRLADLESREELLTRLAGLMHGALANTARLLNALPEKQARLLQALIDEGGTGQEAAGAPAAAAPAEPVDEGQDAGTDAAAADAAEPGSDDDADTPTGEAPGTDDQDAGATTADADASATTTENS